jgi:hypothetical protein
MMGYLGTQIIFLVPCTCGQNTSEQHEVNIWTGETDEEAF